MGDVVESPEELDPTGWSRCAHGFADIRDPGMWVFCDVDQLRSASQAVLDVKEVKKGCVER